MFLYVLRLELIGSLGLLGRQELAGIVDPAALESGRELRLRMGM